MGGSPEHREIEPIVVPAGDVRDVADAIARGFMDNEIWVWLVPNDRARARVLRRHYRMVLRRTFMPRGTAWTTPGLDGGALWFGPERPYARRDEITESLSMLPHLGSLRRGLTMERALSPRRPAEPHWYLSALAVDSRRQGIGIGSALIRPGLRRCDERRTAAYVESNREANLAFYGRFGFELTEQIVIPGGPPVWLMRREPA